MSVFLRKFKNDNGDVFAPFRALDSKSKTHVQRFKGGSLSPAFPYLSGFQIPNEGFECLAGCVLQKQILRMRWGFLVLGTVLK